MEGRKVKVTARRDGSDALITVTDNGIGIAPELLSQIFDLFTQADRSLDRSQGGLGIGLYICRRLIEMHGGNIAASSRGVGHGASFSMRLPLLQQPAAEDTESQDAQRARAADTSKRVLIVDDNVDSAVTLSWLLAEQGYAVHIAHDGAGGLKAAQDFKPDILLLDIGLPGMNGYELGRRLRADGFASAYMVAISGYARESDVEKSRLSGFDHHFAKPVDLDQLIAKLATR
jgi:CheY-like chemotaxis protein